MGREYRQAPKENRYADPADDRTVTMRLRQGTLRALKEWGALLDIAVGKGEEPPQPDDAVLQRALERAGAKIPARRSEPVLPASFGPRIPLPDRAEGDVV